MQDWGLARGTRPVVLSVHGLDPTPSEAGFINSKKGVGPDENSKAVSLRQLRLGSGGNARIRLRGLGVEINFRGRC